MTTKGDCSSFKSYEDSQTDYVEHEAHMHHLNDNEAVFVGTNKERNMAIGDIFMQAIPVQYTREHNKP